MTTDKELSAAGFQPESGREAVYLKHYSRDWASNCPNVASGELWRRTPCRRVASRVLFSGTVFARFRALRRSQNCRTRTTPEREARLMRASLAGFVAAMLFVGSAAAAHRPPGQFYRVRLS